jgi:hypothetical protein
MGVDGLPRLQRKEKVVSAPTSLADAWATELQDRGATPESAGHDGAQSLFYGGASALLAMVAQAGAEGGFAAVRELLGAVSELTEYVRDA